MRVDHELLESVGERNDREMFSALVLAPALVLFPLPGHSTPHPGSAGAVLFVRCAVGTNAFGSRWDECDERGQERRHGPRQRT
jgi:hypothetical protein